MRGDSLLGDSLIASIAADCQAEMIELSQIDHFIARNMTLLA